MANSVLNIALAKVKRYSSSCEIDSPSFLHVTGTRNDREWLPSLGDELGTGWLDVFNPVLLGMVLWIIAGRYLGWEAGQGGTNGSQSNKEHRIFRD